MSARSALIQRIGTRNAVALSRIVGGTRLTVPQDLQRSIGFEKKLGRDLAIIVILHFGGSRIYVPTGMKCAAVTRDAVRTLVERDKMSSAQIARRLGCSTRAVEMRRAEMRAA